MSSDKCIDFFVAARRCSNAAGRVEFGRRRLGPAAQRPARVDVVGDGVGIDDDDGGGGGGRGVVVGGGGGLGGSGGGAGRLTGALALEKLFEFEQLAHEVEIGRDDGPALLDQRVGVDQRQAGVGHQVGDGDGRRARHARVAVHQHGAALRRLPGLI